MSNKENNKIVKRESAFLTKVGNQISVTNKLLFNNNEKEAKDYFAKAHDCSKSIRHSENDYPKAILNYNKAIELNPNYVHAYQQRASSKYWIKDYQGAIEDLTKALELETEAEWKEILFDFLADPKIKLRDFKGAIESYNRAIEINNQNAFSFLKRGNAKKIINDLTGACQDWTKARNIGNKDAEDMIKKYCENE